MQYSTVQYTATQYTHTVLYRWTIMWCTNTDCLINQKLIMVTVHCVQYSTVQYSTVQYSTVQYSTVIIHMTIVLSHSTHLSIGTKMHHDRHSGFVQCTICYSVDPLFCYPLFTHLLRHYNLTIYNKKPFKYFKAQYLS